MVFKAMIPHGRAARRGPPPLRRAAAMVRPRRASSARISVRVLVRSAWYTWYP
jgi:hypothetical protein